MQLLMDTWIQFQLKKYVHLKKIVFNYSNGQADLYAELEKEKVLTDDIKAKIDSAIKECITFHCVG